MIRDLTRRFSVPGIELAWDVWGDAPGPPLVLVHGYTGSTHDFALVIEELAADRRVFAIDHRGHGRSGRTHDVHTYTVDHIVDDVLDFMHHVVSPHDEPFDLLGHSMGGRVAMTATLARRDLVRSLILMDTTATSFGPVDPEERSMVLRFLDGLDADSVLQPGPRGPEDELIEAAVPPEWLEMKAALRRGTDPLAAKSLGYALFTDHLEPVAHQLGDFDAPTTVLVGSEDHPYAEHAPGMVDALRNGTLAVIDGAYHSPQLTHRDAWLAAVRAHLARVDGSRPDL